MDPNLDLDVVSLDKGIADLEATGTSTWDFQTQDCDPLSLAERLKALKERDTAPLLTSGPSNSTPEPEGECKAARFCYVPPASEWNLEKNNVYIREDGLHGRLAFTKWNANFDIIFTPYVRMVCVTASSQQNITAETNIAMPVTVNGSIDPNLKTKFVVAPSNMTISYDGMGSNCYRTTTALSKGIKAGKSLYIFSLDCTLDMHYGYKGGDQDVFTTSRDLNFEAYWFPPDGFLENVSLGQRFSDNAYNIPEEWQTL